MIFRAVVFTFIPTAIELVLVSWLLAKSFSPQVAALVVATFGIYVGWTALMTTVGVPCQGSRLPCAVCCHAVQNDRAQGVVVWTHRHNPQP